MFLTLTFTLIEKYKLIGIGIKLKYYFKTDAVRDDVLCVKWMQPLLPGVVRVSMEELCSN